MKGEKLDGNLEKGFGMLRKDNQPQRARSLSLLKWILRIILGALKLVLGLARIILLLFAMVARIFLSFVRMGTF